MIIQSYLTFSGNCREAMNFYKECLGGELFFQTIGETPISEKLPKKMKGFILHASLTKGDLVLMASDMVPDSGLVKGNSVSLSLDCDNEKEIKEVYKKLSEGGEPTHPLEITFFGVMLGGLKDKFGINWLLHYQKK